MTRERLHLLLQKYRDQQLTKDELDEFFNTLDRSEWKEFIEMQMDNDFKSDSISGFSNQKQLLESYERFKQLTRTANRPDVQISDIPESQPDLMPANEIHFFKTSWLRYAAAVIILFGIAAYFYIHAKRKSDMTLSAETLAKVDAAPGSSRAILTLSDGRKIELLPSSGQSLSDGQLSIGNVNGGLLYKKSDIAVLNTMTTPRGGQYRLVLSDGTRIWLNAASSVTYPTSFKGADRIVQVTGEAYFEVAKNASQPFIVKTDKDQVVVLGTSFNINTYNDEPSMKTTLVEGSVRVDEKILKPGEAFLGGKVIPANVSQDIAWKEGVFQFDHASMPVVFRQLSRWYDIQVVYEKDIPVVLFSGEMLRNLSLNQVIKILNDMEVKCQLEPGGKLVVK